MDDQAYSPGVRVVSLDNQDIGVVEGVDDARSELEVRLNSGDTLRVPFEVIDHSASTPDRIVVQGAVGDMDANTVDDVEPENPRLTEPGDSATLSLVGEEAVAHVRDVGRGRVIINKRVEMVPHEAAVDIGTDTVEVTRVPINEEYDAVPGTRQEEDTLIVPVVEEVLVISKRYRVIEEVHITKRREMHREVFEQDLQREVVEVVEVDAEGNPVDR